MPGTRVWSLTIEGAIEALQEQLRERLADGARLWPALILFAEFDIGEPPSSASQAGRAA
jgi:hypothetical protein